MAPIKLPLFVLASLLLVITTARIPPDNEEHFMEIAAAVPPVYAHAPAPTPAPIRVKDAAGCEVACKGRCALHSRQNVCNRACNTCCDVCKCVPPGTYGYRELCGTCYTNWHTHGNRTKCP